MPTIISTMSSDFTYCLYQHGKTNSIMIKQVTIFGKAGIPQDELMFGELHRDEKQNPVWIASGMPTRIKDETWEWLKDNVMFQKHLEQGLVQVIYQTIDTYKQVDKIAHSDMTLDDGFKQLTPEKLAILAKKANSNVNTRPRHQTINDQEY